ncbi:MAG: hypothetical protein HY901_16295, partial [Deltaproteobacteria bacterium]|nr:hypothetical protein [Deltaproteobacteria bacterium]
MNSNAFVFRALTWACVVASGGACTADLDLPNTAQISCSSTDECPQGWICKEALGRCLRSETLDTVPPALVGDVVVELDGSPVATMPAWMRQGAVATLRFNTSEPLAQDPVVSLGCTERLPAKKAGESSTTSYVFEYVASGAEPQLIDCPISIALVDPSGNPSGGLSGKSLAFDFVFPSLAEPVVETVKVEGSPLKQGASARISFTVTEELQTDPVVALLLDEGTERIAAKESALGLAYTYLYSSDGTEPETREGQKGAAFKVTLADRAGNRTPQLVADRWVAFDRTPPTCEVTVEPESRFAKVGSLVTVTVKANETLRNTWPSSSPSPTARLGGLAMDLASGDGDSYLFTYVVTSADSDGERPIELHLEDLAGNVAEPVSAGLMTFDSAPPAIADAFVLPERIRASESFLVCFRIEDDEPLKEEPVVQFWNGVDPSLLMTRTTDPDCPYPHAYLGTAPVAGSAPYYSITARVSDRAGNQLFANLGVVEIDNVAPSIAGLEVGPAQAKVGTALQLV